MPGEASGYSILDVSHLNLDESTALFTISMILIFADIVLFVLFFSSMLLNCKVYDYEGNQIIIYAGWCHHYIKVNGEKYDEHNTIATFTPIKLNCKLDDGTVLDATISLSNRISLKINDRLYK